MLLSLQKPIIGISANARDNTSCVAEAYYQAVMAAGGVPVILPVSDDETTLLHLVETIDGLLMSGGGDINPDYFGESPIPESGEPNPLRDSYDVRLIRLAANRQLPILGICRGMQALNVVFGGDMYQDIHAQYHTHSPLCHSQSEGRSVCTHRVTVVEGSRLATILDATDIAVNSIHHQAVRRIADGFSAVAYSADGICEAIEAGHYNMIGVQWHPEHLAITQQTPHIKLFQWLVQRALTFRYARLLHKEIIAIDSHCDTPMVYSEGMNLGQRTDSTKVDFVKMREGKLDATCMVAYIPQQALSKVATEEATQLALDRLQFIHNQVNINAGEAVIALSVEAVLAAKQQGKLSVIPAIENGYAIGYDLEMIQTFHRLGVRYITLCHNGDNQLCDSAMKSQNTHNGLSAFGRQAVGEMNRLGIAIDVSHAGEKSFWDILAASDVPVIASHSSARALCNHPRNLTDDQLRALAAKGGVCQVCLYSPFLTEEGEASVATVVAHINHIVKLVGIDFVGIGSDFDGGGETLGCKSANEFINLTIALLENGYSDDAIRKIWGGNLLRVLKLIQHT
ncbi:MAG: gamma-glutamyl-gamma-aminobutyrate hydrolase family protein [Prevotellaceae bacterium]|jgi:microsomal dipeptidase-like Zn-dependent dipeptidase/gamma-glutamyl-gamma-aminobutyrate hydrolase PuuD|nr:gamma-glutamyl-gamma-aminobutyrate hydrolase family protein [Prevotellaceae bacterium]